MTHRAIPGLPADDRLPRPFAYVCILGLSVLAWTPLIAVSLVLRSATQSLLGTAP